MKKTPLDDWIASLTGLPMTRRALSRHALSALRRTLERARTSSPFYGARLAPFPEDFPRSLRDYGALPVTDPGDLAADPMALLAAPQEAVERIVTLPTSGTTGAAKRIFFTERDLARTMDIFRVGMSSFVRPGGRVLQSAAGDVQKRATAGGA